MCIPYVLRHGSKAISEGVIKEADEILADADIHGEDAELWMAFREQVQKNLFEIRIPDTMEDLADAMASAKQAEKKN